MQPDSLIYCPFCNNFIDFLNYILLYIIINFFNYISGTITLNGKYTHTPACLLSMPGVVRQAGVICKMKWRETCVVNQGDSIIHELTCFVKFDSQSSYMQARWPREAMRLSVFTGWAE